VDLLLLLAIGAAVACAYLAIVLARGGLVGAALLVLLAGSCFGHPFFHVATGALPLTSDRLLLVVLVAQYVVYRRWGWTDSKPLAKVDFLLVALLGVLTVNTLTHNFMLDGARPIAMLVIFYLMPATMYWVARETRWSEQAAAWVIASLAVFGLYLCLTAVAETHGWWGLVFPRYIGSPAFVEFFGRGRGPFLNPVANGIVQSVGLCAALLLWPRLHRRGQLILLATVPIYAYGVYSTLTRSVWMGAAFALLIVVAITTPRVWRGVVVGSAVVATLIGVVVGWDSLMTFKRDKDLDAELTAESAKLRPILATVAWHMFLDQPLLGCGFAQYKEVMPEYLSDRSTDLPLEKVRPFVQHNVFLALLTETGLVGVSLFIAVLSWWTFDAWRLWCSETAPLWVRQMGLLFLATIGAYLPNGMFHDVSLVAMVNMLLFFLGGTVVGLAMVYRTEASQLHPFAWLRLPRFSLAHPATEASG
jgi:O-antigen ligase